jgi:hypothetical protein
MEKPGLKPGVFGFANYQLLIARATGPNQIRNYFTTISPRHNKKIYDPLLDTDSSTSGYTESVTKKTDRNLNGEMRPEYDFASMKGGVRGKYVKRLRERSNIVVLEPEVAEAFPNERAVNQALRGVLDTARATPRRRKKT